MNKARPGENEIGKEREKAYTDNREKRHRYEQHYTCRGRYFSSKSAAELHELVYARAFM